MATVEMNASEHGGGGGRSGGSARPGRTAESAGAEGTGRNGYEIVTCNRQVKM